MRTLLLSLALLLVGLPACDESTSASGSSGPPGTPGGPPPIGKPELAFATYLGANTTPGDPLRTGEDTIRDVAIDAAGNVFVSGGTANSAFPVSNAHQATFGGGEHDVIVAKFSPAGVLLWSTFLGGPKYDRAYAIELDAAGNVYVAGRAGDGFPTTAGVLQPSFAGDNAPNPLYAEQDGFVAKFTNGGALVWSTYFGGPGNGFLRDMDVDDAGNLYVTVSEDANSPWVTPGAFQVARVGSDNDAIVGRMKPDASGLDWCSYLSGSGREFGTPSIRVDGTGHVYILGGTSSTDLPTTAGSFQPAHAGGNPWDVALFKFLPDGSDIVYGAYLGGTGNEFSETHGLVVDGSGRAIVGVTTTSTDFPTTIGAYQTAYRGGANRGNYPGDGGVAIVSANGASIVAATYFGGSDGEGLEGIGLGVSGEVVIGGATYSGNLPIRSPSDAYQPTKSGGGDQFVAVLKGDLSELYYSTFIGGSGDDFGRSLVTDGNGAVVVGGQSNSANFPVSNPAHQAANAGGSYDGVLSAFAYDPTP